MSRFTADSRWYRKAKAEFLAAYPICWLCGHPGADQIDHVIPVSQAPWLRFEPSNWRPAHGVRGCQHCGRRCNQQRGTRVAQPLSPRSRRW
jgi:5-methylcytosine-specific restriction endonuclease McrA